MEWYTGEIDDITKKLSTQFIPVDEKEFEEIEIDVTGILSKEELTQKINEMELPWNRYIKIVLVRKEKIGVRYRHL